MAKANVDKVIQAEVREAKKFLKRRNIDTDDISPRKFYALSKKLDKSFSQTLKILARTLSAGQV